MHQRSFPFNVRVYGLLILNHRLLVVDELIRDKTYTKLPGGGLEYGEGTRDCLIREFDEELSQPIEITAHYYTTDYFQPSAFGDREQLISIYYRVKAQGELQFDAGVSPRDLQRAGVEPVAPRWITLSDLKPEDMSFPVDKIVAEKLIRDL